MVTIRIIAACAAALLVVSCTNEQPQSAPPPAPSDPQPGPQVQVATDPCTLLTEAEAGAHVGAQVKGVPDDVSGVGRGCRWEAPGGAAYLSVILNTPAFPDVSSAKRTVEAGSKKGSVLADDGLYCLVYVDNGSPWLQFSSQSAQQGAPNPAPKTYECDRSVPVLRKVVTNLKW